MQRAAGNSREQQRAAKSSKEQQRSSTADEGVEVFQALGWALAPGICACDMAMVTVLSNTIEGSHLNKVKQCLQELHKKATQEVFGSDAASREHQRDQQRAASARIREKEQRAAESNREQKRAAESSISREQRDQQRAASAESSRASESSRKQNHALGAGLQMS